MEGCGGEGEGGGGGNGGGGGDEVDRADLCIVLDSTNILLIGVLQ